MVDKCFQRLSLANCYFSSLIHLLNTIQSKILEVQAAETACIRDHLMQSLDNWKSQTQLANIVERSKVKCMAMHCKHPVCMKSSLLKAN